MMGRVILAVMALAPVVAGFAGALHPSGDSLAVFRLPISGVAIMFLLWARRPLWLVLPGLGICAIAVSSVVLLKLDTGAPGPVLVYQKNMLFANRDTGPLLADIRQRGPDHITLEEVTQRHLEAVNVALGQGYPTRHWCAFRAIGGTMVISRWPEVPGSAFCADRDGLSGVQVRMPQGPVWVLALHLHWPWPHGQAAQRKRLVPLMLALEGPVILGGDFNMVAWSYTMARIRAAIGSRRAGPVVASFDINGLPLPIDHVLAPGGGSVEILPRLGSDHKGILARVFVWP